MESKYYPKGTVVWTTFPKGTRRKAENYAKRLQYGVGGRVVVGEYLKGIKAWEILIAPPAREGVMGLRLAHRSTQGRDQHD